MLNRKRPGEGKMGNATVMDFIEIEDLVKAIRDRTYAEVKPEINEALRHFERAKYILIEMDAAHARES